MCKYSGEHLDVYTTLDFVSFALLAYAAFVYNGNCKFPVKWFYADVQEEQQKTINDDIETASPSSEEPVTAIATDKQ